MNYLIPIILLCAGICFAVEPAARVPLKVPEGAVQIEETRTSIPLAHKARSADLFFKKMAGENDFCVLRPDQASDLAGPQYKEVDGLKTILVKWSFMEPADVKGLDLVKAHGPSIFSKDNVIYVSSSGIDIGDVAKVVEGTLIIQVKDLPTEVVHKLSRIGW